MGFIRLSHAYKEQRKVLLDTKFITDYMPIAPESYAKVYLAGLAFSMSEDNEPDAIALLLDLSRASVTEAFLYWQAQELVNMTEDPLSVEYLPVRSISERVPKFDAEKYKSFNDQLHLMVKDRSIPINEYNEYYTIMELSGLEPEAMLIIIAYCIRYKGSGVRSQYITKVARDIAYEKKLRTYERVHEHLSELELQGADLTAVLKALKLTRRADHTDKQYLLKWKKELGFPQETVIVIAKRVAKRIEKNGMQRLDALLSRYFENRLFSTKEIDEFESKREQLNRLTSDLAKLLGTWVERSDYVIESYVSPWLGMGFSEDALKRIADYCFRRPSRGERPFENMNHYVNLFYKQGLVSLESIYAFFNESLLEDEKIKEILEKAGIPPRPINSQDRTFYKTWTNKWNIPAELIDYACELSRSKAGSLPLMNAIIADWSNKKITTAAGARKQSDRIAGTGTAAGFDTVVVREGNPNFVSRTLTAEELNAMFDRLGDEDL
ncbi:MAG: DnaD domain protein [Firmicutes bacterium]|nr:DnaD domain protein [Bacillota bacterium]